MPAPDGPLGAPAGPGGVDASPGTTATVSSLGSGLADGLGEDGAAGLGEGRGASVGDGVGAAVALAVGAGVGARGAAVGSAVGRGVGRGVYRGVGRGVASGVGGGEIVTLPAPMSSEKRSRLSASIETACAPTGNLPAHRNVTPRFQSVPLTLDMAWVDPATLTRTQSAGEPSRLR